MAAKFWIGGAVNNLWSNTANWSATSGGTSVGAIPSNLDDVTFDGAVNAPCTLDVAVAKVAKTLTIASGYTSTITFNVNLSVSGSITLANAAYTLTGAGLLRMIAAGTWTSNGKTIPIAVEIGGTTLFTCTLADALNISGAFTLTNTNSTTFAGAFPINGVNVTISGSQTITIVNDFSFTGLTTVADANVINVSGAAFAWNTTGLTTTGALTGTVAIRFIGTGTWQGAASCGCSIIVGDGTTANAATTTLSGTILYGGSLISWGGYNAGVSTGVIISTGSTLSISGNCQFNSLPNTPGGAASPLNNVTVTAAATISPGQGVLSITGILSLPNAAVTFAGTYGFTVGTIQNTAIATSAKTYTFTAGNTYTVTGALNLSGATATLTLSLVSSHATNKVALILGPSATQDCGFLNATRIDSSGGQGIFSYKGVLTTCFNWSNSFPVNYAQADPYGQIAG